MAEKLVQPHEADDGAAVFRYAHLTVRERAQEPAALVRRREKRRQDRFEGVQVVRRRGADERGHGACVGASSASADIMRPPDSSADSSMSKRAWWCGNAVFGPPLLPIVKKHAGTRSAKNEKSSAPISRGISSTRSSPITRFATPRT